MRLTKLLGSLLYKLQIIKRVLIEQYLTSSVNGKGRICGDCRLTLPQNIYIGEHSYVNGGELVAGKKSKIVIGDYCMISYNVHIRTTYHNFKDRTIPMCEQGMSEADIIIEDNVWIGHSVQIMSGVTIHTGSVVGAGAVVTHDVPPHSVVGGIPARILYRLNEENEND